MTEKDPTEACTKTKKKSKKLILKHQGDLDPGRVDTSLVSSVETVDLREEPKKKKKKHKKERKETDLELSVSTVNEVESDTPKKKKKKNKENSVECDDTHVPVHVTDSAEGEGKPKKKKKRKNMEEVSNVPCIGDDVIVEECQITKKKKKNKKDKKAKEVDGAPETETQMIENQVVKSKKIKKSDDEGNVVHAIEDIHDQDVTPSSKQKKKKKDKSEREVERCPPAIAEELSSKKKKKKKKKKDSEKVNSGTENDVVAVTEDCHVKPKKRKYEQESDNFKALEQQTDPIEYSMGKTKKKKKNRDASQADKEGSKEHLQNENLTDNGQRQNQREESHSSLNGKEKVDSGDASRSEKIMHLLGGFRKVQANEEGQNTNSGVASVTQWSTANLGSSDRQQKFMRLLGGFKKGTTQTKDGASGAGGLGGRKAFNKEEEEKVNSALESQFQKAMEMKLNTTKGIGLGFQEAPGANKIFYIDKSKSNSVKFEDSD
ncbi:lysine-rich nucleolar protein 1-like [Lingula anatina]|uniref:Small acidic protein n=1 Tax=Lingula anatina TaxID=7574 RepID=A0A1S3J4E1_LINAN|nr:lysine-rich nucleolar protein 1-like [Lingula anatina]XP_023931379.1 lysine-rich nucleolar protein 1-like [Lingula anatina]|eukprot:XP_013405307.1 lysine-rich nucleolar protein 1-like [Lingula anatina]